MKYFILALADQPVFWIFQVSRTNIHKAKTSGLETRILPNTGWPARLGLPVVLAFGIAPPFLPAVNYERSTDIHTYVWFLWKTFSHMKEIMSSYLCNIVYNNLLMCEYNNYYVTFTAAFCLSPWQH